SSVPAALATLHDRNPPLSSRGLGRRPLTAETGVRIPVAVLGKPCKSRVFLIGGPADGPFGPSHPPLTFEVNRKGLVWCRSWRRAGPARRRARHALLLSW